MIKLAIIGAGFIAQAHASAYKQIKNAQIIAVTDKIKETGLKFAKEYNAKFYDSLGELLQDKEINMVDICTPTFTHEDIVVKAAAAKKNIFCEKPLTLTLKSADKMINAVKDNKVKAMVGHVLRF